MTAVLMERGPDAGETEWTISGDPAGLVELSGQLRHLVQALEDCAAQVEVARGGLINWVGHGASGFERADLAQRPKWKTAAGSFGSASLAIADYASDLHAAQSRAAQARALYDEGMEASAAWAASIAAARVANPHAAVAAGADPGAPERAEALAMLQSARADADAAVSRLSTRLHSAEEAAPTTPGIWGRLFGVVHLDVRTAEDFGLGIVIGLTGLAKSAVQATHAAWTLSPGRLGADPAGWRRSLQADSAGAVALAGAVARDPLGVGKQVAADLTNAKTWSKDPAEAAGELVPQVASMLDGEGEEVAAFQATEDAGSIARAAELSGQEGSATAPSGELPSWLPRGVRDILDHIDRTGVSFRGYKGKSKFMNDGRSANEVLPSSTPSGEQVTYEKWDVHPHRPGTSRGVERLVTGSDGSAYYTSDHYVSFRRAR